MNKLSFPQEPAVWIGLATAVIGVVAVFWPNFLTPDQQKTLLAAIVAATPIVLSFVTRSQVTPNAKVAPVGQNIVVPIPAPPTPMVVTPPPVNPQVPPVTPPAPGA
jgi:drug/metabolite transporter (DMT)-like permease